MAKIPFWKQFYRTVMETEKKIVTAPVKAAKKVYDATVGNARQVEMRHSNVTSPGKYVEPDLKNPGKLKWKKKNRISSSDGYMYTK